jgi:hypothetical protein
MAHDHLVFVADAKKTREAKHESPEITEVRDIAKTYSRYHVADQCL